MTAAPKSRSDRSGYCRDDALRRPCPRWGKAIVPGEETGTCTLGAAGVLVQTRKERSAEITSGRTAAQQGLTATCRDRPQETLSKAAGGQRFGAWACRSDEVGVMSREETPDVSCMTVTPSCSKGALGAWQFQGGPRTLSRGKAAGKEGTTLWVNHRWRGVCMSVLELRRAAGKTHEGKPRSEPDRVKPAVRDRRGACGNVATMGAGLRPVGKPTELPPDPTGASAPHFYPDSRSQ